MKTLAALFAVLLAAGSAWTLARADDDNGRHRGHYKQQHWRNGQCAPGRYQHRDNGDENRNDSDDGNDDDNGRNNNSQYGQYGQYCNGRYGQYGQYGNNGQYGSGNAVIRGTIVAVNGNQVTVSQTGYGNPVTINDQPALDRQTSGRVSVGRYVTAYGYWQNGVFYATQMN